MISYRTVLTTKTSIYTGYLGDQLKKYKKRHFPNNSKLILLIDAGLPETHKTQVLSLLSEIADDFSYFFLPQGEDSKNPEVCFKTIREIILQKVTRKDRVVVVGGGAVLDAGNFMASIIHRGLKSILIPTTLLSMVDASIGGKNALNIDSIKNQVGTFHQPEAIFIDLNFLKTLPDDEFKSGLGEVVKTLLLDGNKKLLYRLVNEGLDESIVQACIRYKAKVVRQDPFEKKGKREFLNFGHTVGHALEAATGERIKHGFAVAVGMFFEQKIAETFFLNKGNTVIEPCSDKIKTTLEKLGIFQMLPELKEIHPFLKFDKKIKEEKTVRFVYLEKPGKPKILNLDENIFIEIFEKVIRDAGE